MFIKDRAKKRYLILSIVLILMGALTTLTPRLRSIAANPANEAERQSRRPQETSNPPVPQKLRIDYTHFSHQTHVMSYKLACDSCHKFPTKNWKEVRKGDAAFADVADFPEHSSCLNCHRQQFFVRERPAPAICSNCHVNVTPRDTTRFLFPSLGDVLNSSKQKRDVATEFAVNFPHDKHVDVLGLNSPALRPASRVGFVTVSWPQKSEPKQSTQPKSCPVCHQTHQPQGKSDEEYATKPPKNLGDAFWLKKGTFETIPNSHAVCFTCHNTDLGIAPAPSDCNSCHKLAAPQSILKTDFDPKLAQTMGVTDKTVLTVWNHRISSGAFRHEGGEHPNMSCTNCHNVPTMNTLDMKTLVVPTRSCGGAEGCHITATSDDGGILNYEIDQKKNNPSFVCTKCHISYGKETVPDTHVKAIQVLKKP
jgi:cytochrome c7-like protein